MPITKRSYEMCPLMEEFHVRNILGGCEKRQWLIGARANVATGIYVNNVKPLTWTTLSGGLWDTVDHAQVLVQFLNAAPANIPFVIPTSPATDLTSGFSLTGEVGDYSIVALVTLPSRPRTTAKWAKDYCPYCKAMGFKAILGGILKDVAVFSGTVLMGSGAQAVTFADLTKTSKNQTGIGSNYPDTEFFETQGSQRPSLITMMADDQYQIILTKSLDTPDTAVTQTPYPTLITNSGFTVNGDSGAYYDVLILGQINF